MDDKSWIMSTIECYWSIDRYLCYPTDWVTILWSKAKENEVPMIFHTSNWRTANKIARSSYTSIIHWGWKGLKLRHLHSRWYMFKRISFFKLSFQFSFSPAPSRYVPGFFPMELFTIRWCGKLKPNVSKCSVPCPEVSIGFSCEIGWFGSYESKK